MINTQNSVSINYHNGERYWKCLQLKGECFRYVCLLLLVVVGMLREWKAEKRVCRTRFLYLASWYYTVSLVLYDKFWTPNPNPNPAPNSYEKNEHTLLHYSVAKLSVNIYDIYMYW